LKVCCFAEELYLTLLARVAFPDSLSTCPIPFLDVKEGLCVYEVLMSGMGLDQILQDSFKCSWHLMAFSSETSRIIKNHQDLFGAP
jgi:hypothetical protein